MSAYVQFLGTVGRERVGARQIHQAELVALEMRRGLGGVDGDTAVVAHAGMRSAGVVEERRLAAVGVAHQGHVNHVAALASGFHQAVVDRNVFHGILLLVVVGVAQTLAVRLYFRGRDDFNQLRLAATQRHLVAHEAVFHRVVKGRVEQRLNRLAAYESHFHNAFAEAAVAQHLHNHAFLACLQFR